MTMPNNVFKKNELSLDWFARYYTTNIYVVYRGWQDYISSKTTSATDTNIFMILCGDKICDIHGYCLKGPSSTIWRFISSIP